MRRSSNWPAIGLISVLLANLACATVLNGAATPIPPQPVATATTRPVSTAAPSRTAIVEATAGPSPTARPTLGPVDQAPVDLAAGLLAGQTLPDVSTRYAIDVSVAFTDRGTATLEGISRLLYTNRGTEPIADLVLMLWPNHDDQYLSSMTLSAVTSGGVALEQIGGEPDGVAQRFALPTPLAPGATLDVSTAFSIEALPGIDESGAARFGLTNDVLLAPTFYPLVPRRIGSDWDTQLAVPGGDTTNSDSATFVYVVHAPAEDAIVASGIVLDERVEGDTRTQTLVAAPMRDLALVVGPLTRSSVEVDGVTINAYMLDRHADFTDEMLAYGADQLRNLNQRIGPYPYTELDLVDAPGAFGGIEYPGEVFIGVVGPDSFFEIATVHEVGHQWFYGVLGDDQLREPWLDEGFASYTEVLYFESKDGSDGRERTVEEFRSNYEAMLTDSGVPIGLPVERYDSDFDYYAAVYSKGAVFIDELRTRMGDEAFFAFLQTYYSQNRFGFVTGSLLQKTAETTCGCDLAPLFSEWVYGPDGPPAP